MSIPPRRFLGYEESRTRPNIVVDGSPNEATVLSLTHWPHQPQPPGASVDTSTELVFAHLDRPVEHEPAEVVTNNHFDQDGAAGLLALIDPVAALEHRDLLIDLAAAGDFGTYRHRDAARASMILHAFGDRARSPIADRFTGDLGRDTALLYEAVLPDLLGLLTDPGRHRDLWAAEDEVLSASEEAVAAGRIVITEDPALDLAVVRVDEAEPVRSGHRFGHLSAGPVHPMAIHNATTCTRILIVHGTRFHYTDRYETWVQVHTHTPPLRTDLRPLATALTESETGGATWSAEPPSALAPRLTNDQGSSLTAEAVVAAVRHHLETAPTAWDPFASG